LRRREHEERTKNRRTRQSTLKLTDQTIAFKRRFAGRRVLSVV